MDGLITHRTMTLYGRSVLRKVGSGGSFRKAKSVVRKIFLWDDILPPNRQDQNFMGKIQTMSQLIAQAESSQDQNAVRFEPAWKSQNGNLAARWNKCDEATGIVLASCSWGLYQIMGDNLYGLGMESSVGEFLAGPELQEEFFGKFVTQRGIDITLEQFKSEQALALNFCHHYNGNAQVYFKCLWTILSGDGQGEAPALPTT
jgi:hypothetical protein